MKRNMFPVRDMDTGAEITDIGKLSPVLEYDVKNPGMCWNCIHARSVSTDLLRAGWCGCETYPENFKEETEAERYAVGWISSEPPCRTFPQSEYGCFSNNMPIVKNVSKCLRYKERE